jgi:hypothetical protein
MSTKFWSGILKERDYSEVLGVDEGIILKWILRNYGGRVCTCVIWFGIEAVGVLLRTWL